ncbi:TULIP family P47-like protein [Xylophilus sp. GW821-FHT01B05]
MSATANAIALDHPMRFQFPLPEARNAPIDIALPPLRQGIVLPPLPLNDTPIHNTLGWDTVFAVPVVEVNKHFSRPDLYPLDFEGTLSGALFTVNVSGVFRPWSIALNGSGAILNLSIPIASGRMTGGQTGTAVVLAGGSISVEVKLNYLPQPAQGPAGTPNQLQVSTKAINATGNIAQVTNVAVPGQTDQTLLGAIQGAFQDFFNKHLDRITYVFNTVNLGAVADQDAFTWLQPTYTSYAYYDAPTLDRAVFGVLCMVSGNSPGQNSNQIGPGSIPSGAQSGFNISDQLFMKRMVLPVMANSFNAGNSATIDQTYFKITNNDTVISNAKTIPMPKVRHGSINYHPKCTDFKVTLQATQIIVYSKVHIEISPGIDAYVESTNYFDLKLQTDDKGNQYLAYEIAAPARTHHWVDVATGIVIAGIVIGIVGAVAAGVAAKILEGAMRVVVGIIIVVVAGVAAAVPQLIAKITSSGVIGHLPSIGALVTAATNKIKWSGGQDFDIKLVQLNGSLQMGGLAFPTN